MFGSDGRGEGAAGSDLDPVLVLTRCDAPIWESLRRWDTNSLTLVSDLLVYSLQEWRTLPNWNPRPAEALSHDSRRMQRVQVLREKSAP
jgi:hypothetical protein